jgi:predicted nuclease with RNAse H fold
LELREMPGWDELDADDRIVHGRALASLGVVVLEVHPECAEQTDLEGEYRTRAWLEQGEED